MTMFSSIQYYCFTKLFHLIVYSRPSLALPHSSPARGTRLAHAQEVSVTLYWLVLVSKLPSGLPWLMHTVYKNWKIYVNFCYTLVPPLFKYPR
jgi:hypothetical protein